MNIKEEYENCLNNLQISEKLIYELCVNYSLENSLQHSFKAINFSKPDIDFGNDTIGFFNFKSKTLCINIEDAISKSDFETVQKRFKNEKTVFEYECFFISSYVYHELGHAKQLKNLNSILFYPKIKKILNIENKLLYDNYDIYDDNHDLFAMEHDADITGMVNALDFNKQYQEYYRIDNLDIKDDVLYNYEIEDGNVISPFEQLVKIAGNNNLLRLTNSLNYPLGVRACFGLPINGDEYTRINDMNDNEIKELIKTRK